MLTFSFSSFFLLSQAPMIIWASMIIILVEIGDPDDKRLVTCSTIGMLFPAKLRIFLKYRAKDTLLNEWAFPASPFGIRRRN